VAERPPFAVAVARWALALLAVSTALAGLGSAGLVASVAWLDPTLGGDISLGIGAFVAVGLVWLAGAGAAGLAAVMLGARDPIGVGLATVLGVAALPTPAVPLAAVILWGLWVDEEGRAWRR